MEGFGFLGKVCLFFSMSVVIVSLTLYVIGLTMMLGMKINNIILQYICLVLLLPEVAFGIYLIIWLFNNAFTY